MTARISDIDTDPERGVFLLPNGEPNIQCGVGGGGGGLHTPNGSNTSERTDDTMADIDETLSTSRETESSTATPTKPLLITRPLNTHHTHPNHGGGGHIRGHNGSNGHSRTSWKAKQTSHSSKQKRTCSSIWKGREHWCCIIGAVSFVLGAILLTLSVLVYLNGRAGSSEPCLGASTDNLSSQTPSSPHFTSQQSVIQTTSTTTTQPTTTFNYDDLVNIAAGMPTYQSSTQNDNGTVYAAAAATDGRVEHTLASQACALTEPQLKPFLWLVLDHLTVVKRIRIFTPTDCCHNSLVDFEVRIGQYEELSSNALCRRVPGVPDGANVVEVVCRNPIYGRFVSIQMMGSDGNYRQLAVCEIEVYER